MEPVLLFPAENDHNPVMGIIARRNPKAGFAIIDLLAITVLLSVFATIGIAALGESLNQRLSGECMNNQRDLISAWTGHAADNDATVCNNFTIPATLQSITEGKFENWANNIMSWSGGTSIEARSITNSEWAKRSPLGAYAANPSGMAKCPADNFLSAPQRSAGWKMRMRSYSMNAFMGRTDTSASSLTGRSWAEGGAYRQFLKTTDIPDPGKTWVTIEEHADSINDGFFIVGYSATEWGDRPASLHSGGATFSFADGHVELRKWRSRTSRFPVTFSYGTSRPFDAPGRLDFLWYRDRVGYVRLP
jgi:prepilin-type processing-associated H-X9-DG protein